VSAGKEESADRVLLQGTPGICAASEAPSKPVSDRARIREQTLPFDMSFGSLPEYQVLKLQKRQARSQASITRSTAY